VDSNRIAGAVVLVLRGGQVVYERAVGFAIVQRLGADNTLSSEGTYGWGSA
jgi:hypothetical protein